MSDVHPGFTLSQLIETTAKELKAARKNEGDGVMQFAGCELELAVKVKAEASGGIKFWLIETSASGGAETASRIKLSFGPILGQKAMAFQAKAGKTKGIPFKK